MKLTSVPSKMVAPVQAYWKMYNEDKIRPQLLSAWKKDQGIVDNTDHLGDDEGLEAQKPKLTDAEQKAEDDKIMKSIPIGFRTKTIHRLYKNEPQEIKDRVDRQRKSAAGLVEDESDLKLRHARLKKLDR